jgi:transcriptional regulator with XRE-family HTH domain
MGAELRLARAALGMSRLAVAQRAGVARSTVERIEDGDASVQVNTLAAVLAAVGLDIVLQAYEGSGVSLHDRGQMEVVEQLRSVAAPYWRAQIEVAAGEFGRSADLVFYGADEIQHHEIERAVVNFQAQLRSALRKREALAASDSRPVRLVLDIEDTQRNRDALRPHAALLAAQLPAGTREVMHSLRAGRPLGQDGLAWVRRGTGRGIRGSEDRPDGSGNAPPEAGGARDSGATSGIRGRRRAE